MPNHGVVVAEEDTNISCAGELWNALTAVTEKILNAIGGLFKIISEGIGIVAKFVWYLVVQLTSKVLIPLAMTGANILGYLFEKFLFGSPGLHPLLQHGLIASEIPNSWREYVRNNTGWDIYNTMHPVLNNFFGLLGGGIGVLNFINHLLTSIRYNIPNYSHLLGENGVFGIRDVTEDKRHIAVKVFFGLLTLPVVLAPLVITNIFDGVCAVLKHFCLSFYHNTRYIFNFLGNYGVMGERRDYADTRGKPAKIIYGLLSMPFVVVSATITNLTDMFCTFVKHFSLSFGRNLRCIFNLLGESGVMGPRRAYVDERSLTARIIYGIFSAPLVAVAAFTTNLVDGLCALPKNMALSFWRNLRSTFNLLGSYGVMGERREYQDERGWPARIIYGILSALLVAPVILVTNIIDAIGAITKNLFLSFGRNLRPTFNLLGENGVMGPRRAYEDDRGRGCRILYGALTVPLVAFAALVSNTVDVICAVAKNLGLSIWRNLRSTYNLLGKSGVLGERKPYADDRGKPARIIYGIFSLPVVLPVAAVTNLIDGFFTFIHHNALSFYFNLVWGFNLLGENGVMGARKPHGDSRSLPVKIIFGIFSAPLVAPLIFATNIADAVCAFARNYALSFCRVLSYKFNALLGEHGVMGARRVYQDDRGPVAIMFYNTLVTPLVAPLLVITNSVDAVATFFKHLFLSFGRLLRSSFNLLLGGYGVMGERRGYIDDRHLATQIVFGAFATPFVLPLALITNITDAFCAFAGHLFASFKHNTRRIFNLLGDYGVMGPHRPYEDGRGMPARIVYGLLSLPLVLPTAIVTNVADAILSFGKHFFLSFGRNLICTFNLLGDYGVMGSCHPYQDERGLPAKIFYGILSAPLVVFAATFSNVADIVCSFMHNCWLSFKNNLRSSYHLLGHYGVMGERIPYEDCRGRLAKIVYGVITAPAVFALALVTNVIDAVCAYFKNYDNTIKKPIFLFVGVAIGAALALPIFVIRKTVTGFFNFALRPIMDAVHHKPFNCTRMVKGVANVASLGGFSAVKKVFKACTGYTDRFGFLPPLPTPSAKLNESTPILVDVFNRVQNRFRDAINLATKGKFPGVPDGRGYFRPFMRVFYGMRNSVEKIVKAIHDAYLQYADALDANSVDRSDERFGMHSFFQSREYRQTKEDVRSRLKEGEAELLGNVEGYLLPAGP